MTGLLEWRGATRADRAALCVFECTEKPVKNFATGWKPHYPGGFWEHEVQSWIRSLRPPLDLPLQLTVGFDEAGLAAAALREELDGPALVMLHVMAVALRLRGKGSGYADEMARVVIDEILGRAESEGVRDITVYGHVWHENHASQKFCRRAGLQHTGMVREGVQFWSQEFVLGD